MKDTTGTERVCFLLHLKPDRVEDYLNAHAVVWPDMLDALRSAGWHNYSLFLRPDDGLGGWCFSRGGDALIRSARVE